MNIKLILFLTISVGLTINTYAYDPLKSRKVFKNPNPSNVRQIEKARQVQFPLRK
jgi:hypothetical protein